MGGHPVTRSTMFSPKSRIASAPETIADCACSTTPVATRFTRVTGEPPDRDRPPPERRPVLERFVPAELPDRFVPFLALVPPPLPVRRPLPLERVLDAEPPRRLVLDVEPVLRVLFRALLFFAAPPRVALLLEERFDALVPEDFRAPLFLRDELFEAPFRAPPRAEPRDDDRFFPALRFVPPDFFAAIAASPVPSGVAVVLRE